MQHPLTLLSRLVPGLLQVVWSLLPGAQLLLVPLLGVQPGFWWLYLRLLLRLL